MNISDLIKKSSSSSAATSPTPTPTAPHVQINVQDKSTRDALEEKMKELELKHQEELVAARAQSFGIPYISLIDMPIISDALSVVPEEDAVKYGLLSFFYKQNENWKLGVLEYPIKEEALAYIKNIADKEHLEPEIYLISEESLNRAKKLYASVPKYTEIKSGVTITEDDLKKYESEISDFRQLNQKILKVNVSDIMTLLIAAALKFRSSDIHVEAEEDGVKVRFRIDGLLHDAAVLPADFWKKLISRIKLIAGLKINVADVPQDGRFTIFMTADKIDVRVSTLPTSYGESVVMRLLKSSAAGLNFEDLGLRGLAQKRLAEEVQKTNGMIITTGPTGSGKTTTLYAILNKLNDSETKIITLEDPVEYKLKGINQSQIDHEKGYGFVDGLRSILRQDPDIVMVGELRDFETADVAINAALTGHLVISTIHTNSAAGALPRFLAMGVKPFLLAPALNAVVGQRLCRRVCDACKEEIKLDDETLQKVIAELKQIPESAGEKIDFNNLKFYKGKGCDKCSGLGYKGRIGIYEIFTMNPEIEAVLLSGQLSEYIVQEIARKNGMLTMMQDGLLKAMDGITTVDEVFRVAL
ncbi:MAG TPA: GspE/PulE family protein [bacterium]|nr:GspE/PulE family protein [bacterium]